MINISYKKFYMPVIIVIFFFSAIKAKLLGLSFFADLQLLGCH